MAVLPLGECSTSWHQESHVGTTPSWVPPTQRRGLADIVQKANPRFLEYYRCSSSGMLTRSLISHNGETHIHATKSSLPFLLCVIFSFLEKYCNGYKLRLFLDSTSPACLLLLSQSNPCMSPHDITSHLRHHNGPHTCPMALKFILTVA